MSDCGSASAVSLSALFLTQNTNTTTIIANFLFAQHSSDTTPGQPPSFPLLAASAEQSQGEGEFVQAQIQDPVSTQEMLNCGNN